MIKLSYLTVMSVFLALPAAAQVSGGAGSPRGVAEACAAGEAGCRQAMNDYVDGMRSSGLQGEAFDQGVADLVVALATAASGDGECNDLDRQLGAAISQSSGFATSAAQRGQIADIAEAVSACAEIQTATITPIGDDAVDNNAEGNGPALAAAGRGAASPN